MERLGTAQKLFRKSLRGTEKGPIHPIPDAFALCVLSCRPHRKFTSGFGLFGTKPGEDVPPPPGPACHDVPDPSGIGTETTVLSV